MDVECNPDSLSCSHCCSGKAINITYSECVFVVLGIQHAIRMFYIFICGLFGSTIFVYISQTVQDFRIYIYILNTNCVFLFSLQFWLEYF
jgi:hypothetical protein